MIKKGFDCGKDCPAGSRGLFKDLSRSAAGNSRTPVTGSTTTRSVIK